MARISNRQLSGMCQRVGSSLGAGVDILRVLDREAAHGSPAYRKNMENVSRRVGKGMSLAEGMRECDGYFPQLTCELVDVGEQTGRLESVLLRQADHYQHLLRLRRTFLLGITWPVIQLTAAVLVIGLLILLLGVIGSSVGVFGLSGPKGLATYATIVCVAALVIAVVGRGLLRGWFGPWPGQLLMRVPVVGSTLKTMALARFSWTLSLSLDAGIDACRAVRMALNSTQNRYFMRHVSAVEGAVMRGGQFYEALGQTGAFTDEFLTALENAEVTGTETESLTRLSQDYQKRAEAATTVLTVAASMAIWGLIAALLIFLIFSLAINLYIKPINDALEMVK